MHDLIFAFAFVAMIATPAMVAAIGGRKEFDPGTHAPSVPPSTEVPSIHVPPMTPTVRPRMVRRAGNEQRHLVLADGPTLPMRNARGMANR